MSSQCLSVDDGDRLLLDLSKRVASVCGLEARCARTTRAGLGGGNLRTYGLSTRGPARGASLCHGTGWNINDHVAHYH